MFFLSTATDAETERDLTMTTIKLTGHAAIAYAETTGCRLSKYPDPAEGAREGLTVEQGRAVAAEDPGLIYLETSEYSFGQTFDRDGNAGPEDGTLADAIDWCKEAGSAIDLFDAAGFRRGWVKADGSWSLT